MPWLVQKNGDEWCVYKEGANGDPVGDSLGCHETEAEAKRHLRALYANVKEFGGSMDDFINRVRTSFERTFNLDAGPGNDPIWVTDVFPTHTVVRRGERYFKVPFTASDDEIAFAPRDKWQVVDLAYVPVGETVADETVREMVQDTLVSEFGGQVPSVPFAPGVDVKALLEGDPDPMFLVLPISEEGRVSRNGLIHDAELAESLVQQIAEEKPGGIMGHIAEAERNTAYPVSQVHWVGAMRVGGKVWAKGYIPKTQVTVREEFRLLKAKGGRAATSIYGRAVRELEHGDARKWRARKFLLEQIDLAPYARASLQGSGEFALMAEMEGEPNMAPQEAQETNKMDRKTVLAELTADEIKALPQFAAVRAALLQEFEAEHETTDRIAELEEQVSAKTKRVAELEAETAAHVATIAEYQAKQFAQDLDAKIAELTDWQVNTDEGRTKLASLRAIIKTLAQAKLGEVREMAKAETTLTELMEGDLVKPLAEMTRDALAGPAVVVPGKERRTGGKDPLAELIDETPEGQAKDKAWLGLE